MKHLYAITIILAVLLGCSNKETEEDNTSIIPVQTISENKSSENNSVPVNEEEDIKIEEDKIFIDHEVFGQLNMPRVRLRDFPHLNCETITLLENNINVEILGRSNDKQKINDMDSYWFRIKTLDGYIGWAYGYFLDINEIRENIRVIEPTGDYSNRQVSDNAIIRIKKLIKYNINRITFLEETSSPTFTNDIDSEIYSKLAGIYTMNKPVLPSIYNSIYETKTSWGIDFKFGRGTYKIEYDNGKWYKGGDGEAIYFNIKSYDDHNIELDYGEKMNPRYSTHKLTDEQVVFDGSILYKVSGPENPMAYLKEIIEYHKNELSKYNFMSNDESEEIIGNKIFQIYKFLRFNEIRNIIPMISESIGLTLEFSPNKSFNPDEISFDNSYFTDAISKISDDLNNKYCADYNEAIPLYNEFIVSNLTEIQTKYPNSITTELFYDENSYLVFVFVKENNIWKLVHIVNHSLDFA